MVFTGAAFLFLFLPLFLAVYHLLAPRARPWWMLIASYAFYGWWRLDFLAVFVGSTLAAYLTGRLVERLREGRDGAARTGAARAALGVGIALQLGVLAYFKYADFGVASLNALLASLGAGPLPLPGVILPIGISFYVFQAISYLVDGWRGDAPERARFVHVAAYIALFPQLIAGPIVRFENVGPQLVRPRATWTGFGEGARRFMLGFCKKVLIADAVAPIVDASFGLAAPTAADAWLGALAFAIQLFFDFSGYSDMAIGLGGMMGIRFRENFDRPYLSPSITVFWRRWHMSLSAWLMNYLYIPLGGNRRGRRRTYVNLATVMVVGGIWHGAAWTFVLWGAYHGALLAIERMAKERREAAGRPPPARPPRWRVPFTFLLVLIGWVPFRAEGIAATWTMFSGMAFAHGAALSADLAWQLPNRGLAALLVGILLVVWPAAERRYDAAGVRVPPSEAARLAPGRSRAALAALRERVTTWTLAPLFVLGVMRALADSASPFLYFRF